MHGDFRVALLTGVLEQFRRMRLNRMALIARKLGLIDHMDQVPTLYADVLRALWVDVARSTLLQIRLAVRRRLGTEPSTDFDS